jgi:ketosteroid isomerase-like protein
MNKYLITLICLLFVCKINAQVKNSNLNDLIATEYAFASAASEIGTRDSFLKFVADDGIIFRPNPVNGKTFLSNAQKKPGLLRWYPTFAGISHDGDMGFTTGPADFKKDKDSSAIWSGNFSTVWQRQSNGEFRFVIDMGISNNKPTEQYIPLKYDTAKPNSSALRRGVRKIKADELLNMDKELSLIISKIGVATTYKKFVNEESRLLRDDYYPIIGMSAITEYLNKNSGTYIFKPIGGKISSSRDLGFTYGELALSDADKNNNGRYNYMHIWKKVGKRWIIIIDVTNKLETK